MALVLSKSARFGLAWALFSALLCFAATPSFAEDVYQIYYSDKPVSPSKLTSLEKVYGCKLIVLPYHGEPPATPARVHGVVLHSDPLEDPKWVLGDRNPVLEAEREGGILTDRWNGEATLLRTFGSELYPPTELTSKWIPTSVDSGLEERIKALELLRSQINQEMGKSILKSRTGFGSAGVLPKTNDDWATLYRNYVINTKPKIQELERTNSDPDVLQEKISEGEFEFLEGRVLDQLLEHPDQVLVQKMFPVDKEVRVHVIEGKVLPSGTVNRFDYLGKYVTREDTKKAERLVQQKLLDQLPPERQKLSATMDVIISGDQYFIVDLNGGIESGMYYPENDLYVSNLLASRFSGKLTPYLSSFERFQKAPLKNKLVELKKLVKQYGAWIEETESSGLWDRVASEYIQELKSSPTSKHFEQVLEQLKSAGLRDTWVYHSLIAEVDDRWPAIGLSPRAQKRWKAFLSRNSDDVEYVYTKGKQLRVIPEVGYSDSEAVKAAIKLVKEQVPLEDLRSMSLEEVREHFEKGVLRNFITPDRLKAHPPTGAWAEELSDLPKGKAVFIEDYTFRQLTKKVLTQVGYFNRRAHLPHQKQGKGCLRIARLRLQGD